MLRRILLFVMLAVPCSNFAQKIEVMTYNIRYDNPDDGVNAWPNRKKKVFALLKKYDPDIIGIQEALKHQLEDIQQALPDYAFLGVGRDDGKSGGEYSAILYKKSKFKTSDMRTKWLSETPDVPGSKSWDAAITRIVSVAKFTPLKSGKPFYVLNTHFDHIGKEARKNSAGMIRKIASSLGDIPVLITGDLNCTRSEDPYQKLLEKDGITLLDPAPSPPVGTFCTFVVKSTECNAIDYILHTPQWKAKGYRVINDNDGTHYPSDHLPVMVSVELE